MKQIFATFSFFKNEQNLDSFISEENLKNIVYSNYFPSFEYNINWKSLVWRLKLLGCKQYKIIIVDFNLKSSEKDFSFRLLHDHDQGEKLSSDNPLYILFKYSHEEFFLDKEKKLILKSIKKSFISNKFPHPIFIFKNYINWNQLSIAFRWNGFILGGGSYSKRGTLSPVHDRMSKFLTCLEGMGNSTVIGSYHEKDDAYKKPLVNLKDPTLSKFFTEEYHSSNKK